MAGLAARYRRICSIEAKAGCVLIAGCHLAGKRPLPCLKLRNRLSGRWFLYFAEAWLLDEGQCDLLLSSSSCGRSQLLENGADLRVRRSVDAASLEFDIEERMHAAEFWGVRIY
jgi:hypothetical protein